MPEQIIPCPHIVTATGWQPIATAPRFEMRLPIGCRLAAEWYVDLWIESPNASGCRWPNCRWEWSNGTGIWNSYDGQYAEHGAYVATHWMREPSGPAPTPSELFTELRKARTARHAMIPAYPWIGPPHGPVSTVAELLNKGQ